MKTIKETPAFLLGLPNLFIGVSQHFSWDCRLNIERNNKNAAAFQAKRGGI